MGTRRAEVIAAQVAMHRGEAKRIRAAAGVVRGKGFAQIAAEYDDLALSHELAGARLVREAHKAGEVALPAHAVCALMRANRLTIRQMKVTHSLTLKRIREVRAQGAQGFRALEWVYLITGRWPVAGGESCGLLPG